MQPPQFNQPPYYQQQPPPRQVNTAAQIIGIILIISGVFVFLFGLCTVLLGGIGFIFILMAIPMIVGGLIAFALA